MPTPETLRKTAFALACALPLLLVIGRAPADIAASLIAVLFLLHSACTRNWQWLRAPEARVLLAIWLYLIIASPIASGMDRGSIATALEWIRLPLCYLALVLWVLADDKSLSRISICTLVLAVLFAIDAYWQYATGISLTGQPKDQFRLTGPMYENANIGNLLLKITLPATGWILFIAKYKRQLLAALAAAAFIIVLVPLTGERSITLLEIAGLAAIGLTLGLRNPAMRRTVAIGAVVLAVGAAALSTQGIVKQRTHDLVVQLRHFWSTPYGQIYTAALDMWRAHPLLGVGIHRFRYHCQPLLDAHEITVCDIHAHNIYLHWLAEGGLFGLVLFLAFIACLKVEWLRGWKRAHGNAAIPCAASAGTLIVLLWPVIVTQNMFSNWAGVLFWFSLALAMALVRHVPKRKTSAQAAKR